MKNFLFPVRGWGLLILLLCGLTTQAQSWQWGRRGGGGAGLANSAEKIVDMATDVKGNIYYLAQTDGGGDENFDTGNGDTLAIDGQGHSTASLVSYDCNGKLRWVRAIWGNAGTQAKGMSMDSLGHINILARMSGDELHIGTTVINNGFIIGGSTYVRNFFQVIQYDTAGNYKWLAQPTPDTTSWQNANKYSGVNIATLPNGDIYVYCAFGKGLVSGTTNLVSTQEGLYMMRLNVTGVPKELIKLDMNVSGYFGPYGDYFSYTNFSVTKSRKFVFIGTRYSVNNSTYPIKVGGQALRNPLNLFCFSPTGNLLWKVQNADTIIGGISGRPYIDESKGLIYCVGAASSNGLTLHDTIQGFVIKNAFNPNGGFRTGLPLIMAVDTLGFVKMLKNGYVYGSINASILNDLTFRSDGRLFAYGYGAFALWDGYYFFGGNNGYQTFMPSFDATNGAVLSMDSLKSTYDASYANCITADKNNNIYVGGSMVNNVVVNNDTLETQGGQTDFFIAKFGSNNCGLVPLRFVSYALRQAQGDNPSSLRGTKQSVENIWQTANEINVSHFNIQRSLNGRDFITIGKVIAQNKSTNNYQFTDDLKTKDQDPKTLYYRIESVDFDGRKYYSETRTLNLKLATLNSVSIYPNPSKGSIRISIPKEEKGVWNIKVQDMLGRVLKEANTTAITKSMDMFISNQKGLYFITLFNKATNKRVVEKIVVE